MPKTEKEKLLEEEDEELVDVDSEESESDTISDDDEF